VHPSGVNTAPPKREIEGNRQGGDQSFRSRWRALRPWFRCAISGAPRPTSRKRPPNREAEFRVWDPDGNPIDLSQHGWPHWIRRLRKKTFPVIARSSKALDDRIRAKWAKAFAEGLLILEYARTGRLCGWCEWTRVRRRPAAWSRPPVPITSS